MYQLPFSQKLLELLNQSKKNALKFKDNQIGPEHILIALFNNLEGTTFNYFISKAAYQKYIEWTEDYIYNNNRQIDPSLIAKNVQYSYITERLFKIASDEAEFLKSQQVEIEHFFWALLKDNNYFSNLLVKKFKISSKGFSKYINSHRLEVKLGPTVSKYTGQFESPTVSLYFDLEEFSKKEISEIIVYLSDVYNSISGDELEIVGTQRLEFSRSLEPVFA